MSILVVPLYHVRAESDSGKNTFSKADIYVTTVYNPFNMSDPLYHLIDVLIQTINSKIKDSGSEYKVVDVCEVFNKNGYTTTVSSPFIGSILGMHPDNKGHEIIFEAHKRLSPYS